MAGTRRKRTDSALPGLGSPTERRDGPVYKAVGAQLRALRKDDPEALALLEGIAGAARQLAHVIDLAGGHHGHKLETYALPQLHRELRQHLEALAGRGSSSTDADELAAILRGDAGTGETGGA